MMLSTAVQAWSNQFLLYLCTDWFCRFDLRKGLHFFSQCRFDLGGGGGGGYIWEEFWNVHLLMIEFRCPEVTLYDWQDVKIWSLNN